jgi:hypothetical protein
VTDLLGNPNRRDVTLGELFSEKVLSRPIKQRSTPDGYDSVIIPLDFNSEKPINRWFICDLNVKGKKTKEELLATLHKVYLHACRKMIGKSREHGHFSSCEDTFVFSKSKQEKVRLVLHIDYKCPSLLCPAYLQSHRLNHLLVSCRSRNTVKKTHTVNPYRLNRTFIPQSLHFFIVN